MTRRTRIGARLAAVIALVVVLSFGLAAVAFASNAVRISQVYGGGGGGATWVYDYVELFNSSSAPVTIGGWSIQYGASTGTAFGSSATNCAFIPAGATIPAFGYYLIQVGSSGGTGVVDPWPAGGPDLINLAGPAMSATNGKVALVSDQVFPSGCSGSTIGGRFVDVLGFGTSTTCYETTPTASLTNSSIAVRNGGGNTDTDNNVNDFTLTGSSFVTIHNSQSLRLEPTAQPTALNFTLVGTTALTLGWTNGSGTNRLVVMKAASAVAGAPVDGTSYTANVAFGSGGTIATGEYVVFNGSGNTVAVTGLAPGTTYYVAIFEFNGSASTANYLTTSPLTGSQATTTTGCPTITLAPASVPAAPLGVPYTQNITASGGTPGYTFTVTSGAPPTGLTLATDGTLSGTPTAQGNYAFTVTATDAHACTGSLAYSIHVCGTLALSPSSLPDAIVGTAYTQGLSASGGTASYAFSVTSGTVPTGLTLNSNGSWSGTPSASGTYSFTVTATDATGCTGSQGYLVYAITTAQTMCPGTTPTPNGAVVATRIWNDCPSSVLSVTNNYPAQVQISDTQLGCNGFADFHNWSFSADGGATKAVFENCSKFAFGADLVLNGDGNGEGGLRLSPWWAKDTDGKFMARVADGEIACFGGRLPYYSFTSSKGVSYTRGTSIRFDVSYDPHGLSSGDPGTITYTVTYNGNVYTSGPLAFDAANPSEAAQRGAWGELVPACIGGYLQPLLGNGTPVGLTATWSNITFGKLYSWAGGASGNWTVPTNWSPSWAAPSVSDILQFNTGGTVTATGVATQSVGKLLLSNNSSVNLQPAAGLMTLTVGGGAGAISVPAGSALNLTGGAGTTNTLVVSLPSGSTGSIAGAMTFSGAAHKLTALGTNAIVFQSGSQFTTGTGFSTNPFGDGVTTGSPGSVEFQGGSKYVHTAGANPFGPAGGAAVTKFDTGSLFSFQANSAAPSLAGRTYGDFEVAGNAKARINNGFTGTLSVDRLEIKPGAGLLFQFQTGNNTQPTGTINVRGDLVVGDSLGFTSADLYSLAFVGPSTQTISGAGIIVLPPNLAGVTVNNASGVTLARDLTVSCPFTFAAGRVATGSNTLTLGGTVTGAGAGSYVNGNLARVIATGAQSPAFPIGDATDYTPLSLSYANATTGGTVTAHVTAAAHPQLAGSNISTTKYVKRYWTLTNAGVAGACDATFDFLPGDVQGGAAWGNFAVGEYSGSAWSSPAVGTKTATTTQATGLTSFGDFAIGEPGRLATTTSLASSPNPSTTGASVTLTATVSPGAATGTVTFYDGASLLGPGELASGTATLTLSSLAAGSHSLTASYGGDAGYAGSTSPVYTQTVQLPLPTTYVWNGATPDWTLATNWTPPRTPQPNDILHFDGSATVNTVPTQTIGELDLANNATVSLQAGAIGNTLTLGNASATGLVVPAGCTLTTPVGNYQPPLVIKAGATATIGGAMSWGAVITNNGAFSVAPTGTLTMFVAFVNNGTCAVDGTFLLWTNSADATGNAFTYGPNATLAFKSPGGSPYPVYGNAYWPASNGPLNVSVLFNGNAQSGIKMKVPRTVDGLFQTAAAVSLDGGNLLLNGTVQINKTGAGPGTFASAPTYGPSSTLKYNAGTFTYWCGAEWSADTLAGCPANVQISSGTTLDLGYNGAGLARKCSGNLTIDSGSGLTMNVTGHTMTTPLRIFGDLNLAGTLELSGAPGGDLRLAGNWSRTTGSFVHNGRTVTFNGSGQQTITAAGGETFSSVAEDNSGGGIVLASPVTISGTSGDVLAMYSGSLDLQGHTLTLAGDNGTVRAAGATRSINSTTGPATIAFNGATTLVVANTAPAMAAAVAQPDVPLQTQMVEEFVRRGRGFVLREVAVPNEAAQVAAPANTEGFGALGFDANVSLLVNAHLTFPTSGMTAVLGTLRLTGAGSITNKPNYIGNPTLIYDMPSGITVGDEWGGTGSGVGYGVPSNVTVQAGAGTLVMPATTRYAPGAFQLQSGTVRLNGTLYVRGAATLAASTKLDLNNHTFGSLGTTLTNDGEIAGPYSTQPNSALYLGNSAAPISYTGNGTAGTAADPLGLLFVASSGQTVTLNAAAGIHAVSCILYRGQLVHSERLTLGGGAGAPPFVQIGNGGRTAYAGGSFDVTPTYDPGSGDPRIYYGFEYVPRVTGAEIPSSRQLASLECENPFGVSIAGGPVSAPWFIVYRGLLSIGDGNRVTVLPQGGMSLWPDSTGLPPLSLGLAAGAAGGLVRFMGVDSVFGAFTFNDVELASGATAFNPTASITGTLHMNGGSVAAGNPPTYATGSTLRYESSYAIGDEWLAGTSGPGVPYNVEVAGGTLDFNPVASSTPRAALGGVTVGPGAALTLGSSAGGDLAVAGNWTNAGTITTNGRAVTLNGAATQTVSGAGTFDVLTVSDPNGITLASDVTVSQQLLLNGGNVGTGVHKLVLAPGAVVTRSSGHVVGNLQKTVLVGAGVPLTYEIGDATAYTPVELHFDNVATAGALTAATSAGEQPDLAGSIINPAKSVNRYWTFSSGGAAFDHYSATFTFVPGDLDPSANSANFMIGKHDGGGWSYPTVAARTATSTQATGLTSFSDFALGEASASLVAVGLPPGPIDAGTGFVAVPVTLTRGVATPALMAFSVTFTVSAPLLLPAGKASLHLGTFLPGLPGQLSFQTTAVGNGVYVADGTMLGTPCGSSALTGPLFTLDLAATHSGTGSITINSVKLRDCGNVDIPALLGPPRSVTADLTVALAVSAIGSGSVTQDPLPAGGRYEKGTVVQLTAVPQQHFAFLGWGGDLGGSTSPTTITMDADHAVTATFTTLTHTITASAGAEGTITPSGPVSVNDGADQPFAIAVTSAGYHLADVLVDGTTVGAVAGYTFTNVTANHTIAASFAANPTVTPPVLTVSQQLTGNGTGSGTTTINLGWGTLTAGQSIELWRASFGHYPEYDDAGGSPVLTTPPQARWTRIAQGVTAASYADAPTARDYYSYTAFLTDGYGTRSLVSNVGSALNYHLGDVTNGEPGTGDNLVAGIDISLLGNHYGITVGLNDEFNYLDVGPTTTGWIDGVPLTDDVIEFEDLVMFALNFGAVSAPQSSARPVASAVTGSDALVLERPEKVAMGEPVAATLTLQGSGALRAISTRLAWDAAVVQPVGHEAGEWLTGLGGVAFSARPGMVDAAVLRAQGLKGEGLLATVSFKVLSAGDPKIRIEAVDARDAGNRKVLVAQSERLLAPKVPTVTRLAFAQPNPFRGQATLAFSLAQGGPVELAIYSVDGRRVRTLVNEVREPGEYRQVWDGRDDQGNLTSAGVYYARLATGKVRMTRTFVYLK